MDYSHIDKRFISNFNISFNLLKELRKLEDGGNTITGLYYCNSVTDARHEDFPFTATGMTKVIELFYLDVCHGLEPKMALIGAVYTPAEGVGSKAENIIVWSNLNESSLTS